MPTRGGARPSKPRRTSAIAGTISSPEAPLKCSPVPSLRRVRDCQGRPSGRGTAENGHRSRGAIGPSALVVSVSRQTKSHSIHGLHFWASSDDAAPDIPSDAIVYTVQPVDSLVRIAERFYGDGDKWQLLYYMFVDDGNVVECRLHGIAAVRRRRADRETGDLDAIAAANPRLRTVSGITSCSRVVRCGEASREFRLFCSKFAADPAPGRILAHLATAETTEPAVISPSHSAAQPCSRRRISMALSKYPRGQRPSPFVASAGHHWCRLHVRTDAIPARPPAANRARIARNYASTG